MASKRIVRGSTVEIQFLDHVQGGDGPYEFAVFGRVAAVDGKSVTVEAWSYADTNEKDKTNVGRYTIVRSAITRWWRLRRE